MSKFKMYTTVHHFTDDDLMSFDFWYSSHLEKWATRDECRATGESCCTGATFRKMVDALKSADQLDSLGAKNILVSRWYKYKGIRYCDDFDYIGDEK